MLDKIKNKMINKTNNIIAIGGMIGIGKTTLTNALKKELNAEAIYELEDEDELQSKLLTAMYERNTYAPKLFQFLMLWQRHDKYLAASQKEKTIIMDRTIFEDVIFADANMSDNLIDSLTYYENWNSRVWELIQTGGLPKLYVILKADWKTIEKRLKDRNRESEISNYKENEEYFKKLHKDYVKNVKDICEKFNIPYIIVDAEKELEEKVELIKNKIKTLN